MKLIFSCALIFAALSACANQPPQDCGGIAMYLHVNGTVLEARLAETAAAAELAELLSQGDAAYLADDYGGFEKVGALGFSLPSSDKRVRAKSGDIMLYQGNSIAVFYGENSWLYTPLARIGGVSAARLKAALGAGAQQVTLSLSAVPPSERESVP